jgi:hypothetical protein
MLPPQQRRRGMFVPAFSSAYIIHLLVSKQKNRIFPRVGPAARSVSGVVPRLFRSGLFVFSDNVKEHRAKWFFVVLLPDGTVVEPKVAKRL